MTAGSAYGVIAMRRRQAASASCCTGDADVLGGLDAAQEHATGERRFQHAGDVEPRRRVRPAARQAMRQCAGERRARGIAAVGKESERRAGLGRESRRRGADVGEMRVPHGDAAQHDRAAARGQRIDEGFLRVVQRGAVGQRRELERETGRIDHGLSQDREVALLRERRHQAHLAAGERRLAHAVREDRRLVPHVAAGEQDRAQRIDLVQGDRRGPG